MNVTVRQPGVFDSSRLVHSPPMWGRRRWRWALDTAYWLRAVFFVPALIENESLEWVAMEMMPSHVES